MHKSYYTVAPCQSKFLQKQFDEAAFERHRQELQRAKATVDTSPPKTYMHLQVKQKKLQMEAEKQAITEHENRILLEKMTHIMRTGGGIDNVNKYESHSLNSKKRQRDQVNMTRENKSIMERVMHSSRESELANWQQDWQRNIECMDRISRFPNNWWERSPEGGQSYRSPRRANGRDTKRSSGAGGGSGGGGSGAAEPQQKQDEKSQKEG